MPLEGLLLELTKVKLLGKYSAEKAFLNYYYLGRTGSEELCSFLLASSKEQIGLRSRKKKKSADTILLTHLSNAETFCTYTKIYIFLIKSAANPAIEIKTWQRKNKVYIRRSKEWELPLNTC